MNHDENNLNPNQKPDVRTWIEPELEARVVAWVAGEASAFEIAELERLMAEKPELAIFKRRIEAVHGLVAEAALPDKQPVRLSAERRAKLLATIGGTSPVPASQKTAVLPSRRIPRPTWPRSRLYYTLGGLAAACLLVVLQLSQGHKEEARETALLRAASLEKEQSLSRRDVQTAQVLESPERGQARAEALKAEARAEAMRVPRSREESNATPNRVFLPLARADSSAPAEPPRISVGLLAQSRTKPQNKPIDGLSLGSASSPPSENRAVTFGSSGAGVTDRVSVGGALDSRLPSGTTVFDQPKQTLSDPSPASGALLKRSNDAGGVAFRGYGGVAAVDQLGAVNSVGKDRVAADPNTTAGFSFFDRPEPVQPGLAGTIGSTPSSPPPPPISAFGEREAKSISVPATQLGDSAAPKIGELKVTESVAPLATTGDTVTLQAFEVSAPTKNDKDNAVATRGDESRARGAGSAVVGAKLSDDRETQDKKSELAPARTSTPEVVDAETNTAKESVSTFSLHVSDVSFRLAVSAAAALERGENPREFEIRAEEFYNAFDYGDPAPAVTEKVGARIEQSVHPVLQQRNLLRIAMKVPATGRGAGQPLRLTVLLDTSGSMEREDRRAAVRRALEELIALLGANDCITLIGFARQARLLAEAVPGHQAGHLVELSARTPAEGGTNLEEALALASQLAVRHRLEGSQNRIVLLTDGAANLGNADPAQLATRVETLRQQGIAFDACGIGLEGAGDNVLEALTRKGDGRYYVIDRPEAADAQFARQLAGAFRPAAENVKLQVRFNPARVGNYRLIGFNQHRLREEDFRNDKVDAAELAAEEAATALYQMEVLPQGSGEVGEVYVRFRDAATGAMVERSWTIRYDPQAPRFDRATPSLQLAGVAALVAEKFGETPLAGQFKLGDFAGVVNAVRGHYAQEPRVQELVMMYGRLRRMSGE